MMNQTANDGALSSKTSARALVARLDCGRNDDFALVPLP
jgi:hypothetical protein